jgi:hypothetical protein
MNKLKAYMWKPHKDDECGIGIIAKTSKDAKKLGWSHWGSTYGNDNSWIEVSCTLIKGDDVNLEGLYEGVIDDDKDALRRHIYGSLYDGDCERCGNACMVSELTNDKLLCEECAEKEIVQK